MSSVPDSRPVVAGPPQGEVDVPAAVAALAGGDSAIAVWQNEVGGVTFSLGDRFVKWNPTGSGESLEDERQRMEWLEDRFPAPRALTWGRDEAGEWLVTEALDGLSAVVEPWIGQPEVAVPAIAAGLRRLHDALDPGDCPFDWSAAARLAAASRRSVAAAAGLQAPPPDRLVVCHGDPCAPNTLIDPGGAFLAIVDVGRLGVADRWADLAVASMSLEWNYGPGHEARFFDAYGVAPDPVRVAYYRALWDAT